jgi:hypothetical protein
MKKFSLISVLFFCCFCLIAEAQYEKISEFPVNASSFAVDNLGNFYFVTGNSLTKTDSEFNIISVYDNKSNGDISDIDISNPFRIQLFYRDFNTLIFIDNTLAELRAPIMLDDLQIYSADAVCSSAQGSFRIYDNQNSAVVSFDKDLKIIQTGVNLYSVSDSKKLLKLRETNNYVFVLFESGRMIILDKFGNFYKDPNWQNVESFDYINDELFVLSQNVIYKVDSEWQLAENMKLSDLKILQFEITPSFLFILTEKSLITFKIL